MRRVQKVRYSIILAFLSFIVSIWRLPSVAQTTVSIPGVDSETLTAITTCLPAPAQNQFKRLGQYTDPSNATTYVFLMVSPIQEPKDPNATQAESSDQPVDENSFPVNPWYLVISSGNGACVALNTPATQQLSKIVPFEVGRELELQRIQGVIAEVGGKDKFAAIMFSFEGDNYHGFDRPEASSVKLSRETAWALQQLSIRIPPWTVIEP